MRMSASSGHNLHILIYNGDADMACNYMGDQWFIENVATRNKVIITPLQTYTEK